MGRFHTVEFVRAAGRKGDYPEGNLPEIAFTGRSNCGKSSLLNSITGRKKIARVSSKPGCTRTINFFLVDKFFLLADLPGHGYAAVSVSMRKQWSDLVSDYLTRRKSLKAVFFLNDVRRDYTSVDFRIISSVVLRDVQVIPVATKVDKVSRNELAKRLTFLRNQVKYFGIDEIIPFSKLSGEGKREIIAKVKSVLSGVESNEK